MLILNPHLDLKSPGDIIHIVRGDYNYYHYVCDGHDDRVSILSVFNVQVLAFLNRSSLNHK